MQASFLKLNGAFGIYHRTLLRHFGGHFCGISPVTFVIAEEKIWKRPGPVFRAKKICKYDTYRTKAVRPAEFKEFVPLPDHALTTRQIVVRPLA